MRSWSDDQFFTMALGEIVVDPGETEVLYGTLELNAGEAQLVGRLLDQASLEGLVGTVAGDDTVICVAEDEAAAQGIEEGLGRLIGRS